MKKPLMWLLALSTIAAGFSGALTAAGVETVEIAKIQVVRSLSGMVRDSNGTPVAGATVDEVSADGKTVIQSITTDTNGKFILPATCTGKVRHLRVSMKNFDPLVAHVKLSTRTSKLLELELHVAN